MSIFMIYCPQFWGSKSIYMARKTRYMFESYDQKLIVFAFDGRFHELLPNSFRSFGAICMARTTRYMFERYAKISSFSCGMVVFMSYCPLVRVGRAICIARK